MLALRRAQLEQELEEYTTRLREVEARLDYIEGENAMPADDITGRPPKAQVLAKTRCRGGSFRRRKSPIISGHIWFTGFGRFLT